MTRSCMTHHSISATFMSMCLFISIIISPSSHLPLRRVGVEKKVMRHVENRDLILCWVVQIRTNAKCNCILTEDSHVGDAESTFMNVPNDNGSAEHEILQQPDCSCDTRDINEHISALSMEVGLHLLHTFGQFYDHFLLCLLDNKTEAALLRNPTIAKSKSRTLSWIHQQHSFLKSRDKVLFENRKEDVENCLRSHDEIVWFSSEHVHRHHSRSIVPKQRNVNKLQHEKVLFSVPMHVDDPAKETFIRSKMDHIHESLSGSLGTLSQDTIDATAKSVMKSLLSDSSTVIINGSGRKHSTVIQNTTHMLSASQLSMFVLPQNALHSLSKRSLNIHFNDPKYPKQWHLNNRLTVGMDVNVTGLWRHNFTGQGVTVAVVDDGLEWMNPDLKENYNYKGSWDMNDNDPDPSPSTSKLSNHHGTRCAGEIAAVANNHICGVGVAYGAKISGLRVLDGLMTDSLEAEAFNMKMQVNDIYSCSWGPDDDGRTVDGPHLMAAKAMKFGVDFGRRGYGSIFVLASGNGGDNKDNCNFDGYANSIYTVTIGAVDDLGGMPYYAEECASMLGVTFSSGTNNKRDIVTTDWTQGQAEGCTEYHTGTSAAAPLAAGMIALMLQARPCLTWRDVQYIIILTGQKVDVEQAHSQTNGAGLSHSHKHGFGLLNSWRLVNAARVWKTVPWLTSFSCSESNLNLLIPKGEHTYLRVDHLVSEADIRGLGLIILENVQLTLSIAHPCRGKIGVTLTSPSGTVSVLAAPRPKDNSTDGFSDWTFTSVRCWGEMPTGNWTFNVIDFDDSSFGQGMVTKWRLTLFGTPMTSQEFAERQVLVESAMTGEYLDTEPLPCPPARKYENVYSVSERTLKILILSGAFCLMMAVYETFEYIFCYNDEKKETSRNRRLTERAQHLTNEALGTESDGQNSSGFLNGVPSGNNIHNTGGDEDEDDDFCTSETSRLIVDDRSSRNNTGGNAELPEEIPLSTFRIEAGRPNVVDYLPLPQEPRGSNGSIYSESSSR